MYWGVIDLKLRKITDFSLRQKGFTSEPGCFNNVHTLNEILRLAKTKDGIVILQLDISKAFDRIPHQVIDPALQRLDVPAEIRSAIMNFYRRAKTIIRHGESLVEICIHRGVKQGDPLSPFIFNAVRDPLLEKL
jgi:hypothetical protein